MDLAVDLHGKYDAYAGKIAHAVEPLNLMWLEEPAIVKITQSTTTPICAGENLYLRYGFRDLLEKQAVDIIMPTSPSAAVCPSRGASSAPFGASNLRD